MKVTLQESKEIQVEILKYIREICERENLKYFLAYGTLIGAVRHHGFIPWDDDVDIMMPREDYEKFIQVAKNRKHPYYKLVSYETESEYTLPFPKMIDTRTRLIQNYKWKEKVDLGIYVDIFLLDGAGDTEEIAKKLADESFVLLQNWYRSAMKPILPHQTKVRSLLLWLKNTKYRKHHIRHYLNEMKKHNAYYSYYLCNYVAMLDYNTSTSQKNYWTREAFGEGVYLKFENEIFKAPVQYDEILRSVYGEYMKLPPEDKRVSEHEYTAYWLEK